MTKRRRLSDLYVRGTDVKLEDGLGTPVVVWIQKLNPIDRETVVRRAQAAQARHMMEADSEESELFQSMYAQIREMAGDRDALVTLLIAEDLNKYRERVAAEQGMDEETWAKDNYLQGLMDSWVGDDNNPGLAQTLAEDPEDPEANRVIAEIERFEQGVNEVVEIEKERLVKDWVDVADEALWRKAAHRILEIRGVDIYNRAYEYQQLFFAVREPENHAKRYFGAVAEINDLDDSVRNILTRQLANITVDPQQGKSSPVTTPSSKSSDQSLAEEASLPSGPEAASE
jgi:hypothetical protein